MTTPSAISLMYHDVIEPGAAHLSGFPGAGADIYKLTRAEFAAHLAAVRQAVGSRPTGLADENWGDAVPVLFTFDDGGASFYDPIAGMLEEQGWRGWFFISTAFLGTPGFMTPPQVAELSRRGHVIGSHSVTHPTRMAACSTDQLRREWLDSVRTLEDITGAPVRTASVPGGYYSPAVAQTAAEAGIRVLFNSEPVQQGTWEGETTVLGRYAIQTGMPAGECAAFARGDRWPVLKQKLLWDTKKLIKGLGGTVYLKLREKLLAR
ncbi:MAG: polysaccharide deacetylase family protein [Acidobacteria bacterium]|nr:polysaccharide deacetylase family protein [Acidobacteriota bacterium]